MDIAVYSHLKTYFKLNTYFKGVVNIFDKYHERIINL